MVKPSDPSPGGLDINAVYSPGTAATEVEQSEASEEAALGRSGANGLLAVTILELIGTTVMAFVLAPAPPPAFELVFAYGFVGVFAGLPNPLEATRYHSLVVERTTLPEVLEITAETDDGLIMGLRHRELMVEGVQFHPESVLTHGGHDLVQNFLDTCVASRG